MSRNTYQVQRTKSLVVADIHLETVKTGCELNSAVAPHLVLVYFNKNETIYGRKCALKLLDDAI